MYSAILVYNAQYNSLKSSHISTPIKLIALLSSYIMQYIIIFVLLILIICLYKIGHLKSSHKICHFFLSPVYFLRRVLHRRLAKY